ncbi:MAG: hypothetical protein JSR17_03360 [Proteobacteria bacterium]|nr:hypothetical protein [Pseudomonadota bacterium]
MALGASDNGKSYKQLMQEFNEMRTQVYISENKSQVTLASLEQIRKNLLAQLEDKKSASRQEIEKAENKKSNLIKRLVMLEKAKDIQAQDEIIKELEEYSRIRRYRDAQLAKIAKEIQDINLTENEFKDKVKQEKELS